MSQKKSPKPIWWKNTYFWLSGILFILAVVGLPFFGGDNAIRDPGQKHEDNLFVLYFVAGLVMLIGGVLSHRQTVHQYEEEHSGTQA